METTWTKVESLADIVISDTCNSLMFLFLWLAKSRQERNTQASSRIGKSIDLITLGLWFTWNMGARIATWLFEKRLTLSRKYSITPATVDVQWIKINPRLRVGWSMPNRAKILAPAPSPRPMTYGIERASKTSTSPWPIVLISGNWKLVQD